MDKYLEKENMDIIEIDETLDDIEGFFDDLLEEEIQNYEQQLEEIQQQNQEIQQQNQEIQRQFETTVVNLYKSGFSNINAISNITNTPIDKIESILQKYNLL